MQIGVTARIALKGQPKNGDILRNVCIELSFLHLPAQQC